jgi:hypothetical protein
MQVSDSLSYRVIEPTLGISCELWKYRQCLMFPAGATIRPTHGINESGPVMHVNWGEKLLMMFTQDFQRNTTPLAH